MQMIVHGFPSRLVSDPHSYIFHIFIYKKAALQFEWAWQHPHKSRHLRDDDVQIFGRRGTKRMNKLIE